jgi:uncharacterized protein (TIGR02145 family)
MKKNTRIFIFPFLMMGLLVMLTNSCKKDDDNNQTSGKTIKDIDGNEYHIVTIGTQVWMAENLKTAKYRDGSPIPNVTDDNAWSELKTGAYCNYGNDAANGIKYGKLYNGYAVNDSRNIAPVGWHVPTYNEWTTLENYLAANLGNSGSVAKALAAKTDWAASTESGEIGNDLTKNNTSGFTALPGGNRSYIGSFSTIGDYGVWWSFTGTNTSLDFNRYLYSGGSSLRRNFGASWKEYGFSVRCIKD